MEYNNIIKEAINQKENAYCPYSNFKVGAAILTSNGNIYGGCNIENSSFGATICAERSAISNALAHGEKEFLAIAITADKPNIFPCGICRQVLSEFGDILVLIVNNKEDYQTYNLSQLIPQSFTKEDLK